MWYKCVVSSSLQVRGHMYLTLNLIYISIWSAKGFLKFLIRQRVFVDVEEIHKT